MQDELRHKLSLAENGDPLITISLSKREAQYIIDQIDDQIVQIERLRGAVQSLIQHPIIRAAAEVARVSELHDLGQKEGGD